MYISSSGSGRRTLRGVRSTGRPRTEMVAGNSTSCRSWGVCSTPLKNLGAMHQASGMHSVRAAAGPRSWESQHAMRSRRLRCHSGFCCGA